jgi:hypothetical protein
VRLTFEQGYVALHEWVPTTLTLRTMVDPVHWQALLPGDVTITTASEGHDIVEAKAFAPEGKSVLYTRSIQADLRDLAKAIHARR